MRCCFSPHARIVNEEFYERSEPVELIGLGLGL